MEDDIDINLEESLYAVCRDLDLDMIGSRKICRLEFPEYAAKGKIFMLKMYMMRISFSEPGSAQS